MTNASSETLTSNYSFTMDLSCFSLLTVTYVMKIFVYSDLRNSIRATLFAASIESMYFVYSYYD